VLVSTLALWLALLPFISAVHMAMVPHVYSAEHRHFHEVATNGRVEPVEDDVSGTASYTERSSASLLTTINECSLCNLALRQGAFFLRSTLPELVDHPAENSPQFFSIHVTRLVIYRAPKHSPPFQTA